MDIILSELDCSGMLVDVAKLGPKKDIVKTYAQIFTKHEEFYQLVAGINAQHLFRYIALVYDRKTPLRDIFPDDIKKMKSTAAQLAGFKKAASGRYNDLVEKLFVCGISDINKMIIRYCVLCKSTVYMRYIVMWEVYQKESENLLSGGKTKIDDFKKVGEELDDIRAQMLNEDNSSRLEESFIDFYIKDKLELRPEDIAQKIKNGEPIRLVTEEISQD